METTIEAVGNGAALARGEPLTPKGIITKAALDADYEQRLLVAEYVRHHMNEDVDYGTIPGTPKPTLLKPGAEKLTDLFRCTPRFKLMKAIEDFDKGLFSYIFRVQLIQRDAGAVVAEGFGSANSREGRYRWRDAKPKCPNCEKETVFRSKNEGEGFYCWKKKGGCGATFGPDEKRIIDQPAGRVENDDVATLANTILKMAKKRAHVDGAIALARCSDMFTQDVEDLDDGGHRYTPKPEAKGQRAAPSQASAKTATEPKASPPRTNTQTGKPSKMTAQDTGTSPAAQEASAKVSAEQIAARHTLRVSGIWKRAQALGMTKDTFANWRLTTLQGLDVPSRELTDAQIKMLEDDLAEREIAKAGG